MAQLEEDYIKLCHAVQAHECLYDRANPDFNKKEESGKAWQIVANQCCETVSACMARWIAIQKEFTRSVLTSGEEENNKYYLYDQLKFLIPHIYINELEAISNNACVDPLSIDDSYILNNSETNDSIEDYDKPTRVTRSSKRFLESYKDELPIDNMKRRRQTIDVRPSTHKIVSQTEVLKASPKKSQKEKKPTKISLKKINDEPKAIVGPITDVKEIQCELENHYHDADYRFLISVMPHMTAMNARQKMIFKKKIFESLAEVFDCPEDFPSTKDIDNVKKTLDPKYFTDSSSVGEIRLIRELVSLVQSAKQTPELMSQAKVVPINMPASNPENNVSKDSGSVAVKIPTNNNTPDIVSGRKVVYVKRIESEGTTKITGGIPIENSESNTISVPLQKKASPITSVSVSMGSGTLNGILKNNPNKNIRTVGNRRFSVCGGVHPNVVQKLPILSQTLPDSTETPTHTDPRVTKIIRSSNSPIVDISKNANVIINSSNSPSAPVRGSISIMNPPTATKNFQLSKANNQKFYIPNYGIEKRNFQNIVENSKQTIPVKCMQPPNINNNTKNLQRGTSVPPKPVQRSSNSGQGQNTAVTIASDDFYPNNLKKEYDF